MARNHGKNAYITIEDASAASKNISGTSNEWELSWTGDHPEVSGFGDQGVQRSASAFEDCKLSVTGQANDDGASGTYKLLSDLKQRVTLVNLGPSGSATLSPKLSACLVLDDFSVIAPLKNIVAYKASFSQVSGSLTLTEWEDDMAQTFITVLQSSASLAASGSVSGSAISTGYARLVGSVIANASAKAGSGLRVSQSPDSGSNWDYVTDYAPSACSGSAFSIEIIGNAVKVDYITDGAASLFRTLWQLRPI